MDETCLSNGDVYTILTNKAAQGRKEMCIRDRDRPYTSEAAPYFYERAEIKAQTGKYNNFCVHYAVKANANHKVLTIIRESGLGADLSLIHISNHCN